MENLLNNNSNEMKTIVETFVIEETASLIYDNEQLDKWNGLVAELGLTGQTSIQTKEKSPIPFMHLKANFVAVFETLCPRKVDVSEYNISPIPLEILDLIALSVNEKYFDKIQIWYDDKNPDPVCIGLKGSWYSYTKDNGLHTTFPMVATKGLISATGTVINIFWANGLMLNGRSLNWLKWLPNAISPNKAMPLNNKSATCKENWMTLKPQPLTHSAQA